MTSALERTLTPPSDSHFSALFSIFLIFFYFDFRFISFRLFRSYVISTGQVQGSLSLEEEEEFWSRYLTKLSLCAPLQCQPRVPRVCSSKFSKYKDPQKNPNNNNKNCAVSSFLKFCVHRIGLRWCSMAFYLVICAVRNLEDIKIFWNLSSFCGNHSRYFSRGGNINKRGVRALTLK